MDRKRRVHKLLVPRKGREEARYDYISSEESDDEDNIEPRRGPRIYQGRVVRRRICRRLRNQSTRLTKYKDELDMYRFGARLLDRCNWPYRYSEVCSKRPIPTYAPDWTKANPQPQGSNCN